MSLPLANDLYETDLALWSQRQADLLRQRRFADLDLENLIEEVEGVGASERKEIYSRLIVLLHHLLKWEFQPEARSYGWRGTIGEQRLRIRAVLAASPSLATRPQEVIGDAYAVARIRAARETGLAVSFFPEACPVSAETALDDGHWPGPIDPLALS
jgi:Domain of unknown function DUF29